MTNSFTVLLVFHGFLLVLCIADALFAPAPKSLLVEREAKDSTSTGETITEKLILCNASNSKMRGEIRNAWPPSAGLSTDVHKFSLAPMEKYVVEALFTPKRRGTLKSEHVTIRTIGPIGLGGRQKEFSSAWDLRVLPPFIARKHLPSRLVRLREIEGRALLLVRGQGTEFDSLREYVAGDDVRAIDWRSSARLGHTVVRTWRPERDRQIVVVLDSGRAGAMRYGEYPAFDTFIESSLLLSALASRAGDRVSIFALDDAVHGRSIARDRTQVINQFAQALADVEPTLAATDWALGKQTIEALTSQSALVVVLTSTGLSTISDGLFDVLPQIAKRHRVVIGTLTDATDPSNATGSSNDAVQSVGRHTTADVSRGATVSSVNTANEQPISEAIFDKASQARTTLENEAILQELKRLGAVIVTGSEQSLPPRIADCYIDLKARGKL
ncbi:DUF58 domain-containing protein [Arcanobacterium bovis]|uniref:DUF58 domain-containing protein n=1 Tax=Arcanobacterium bovis TaxID=2529275 RepID=UPI0013F17E0D|nr:DUF58 domain-containing protein [Arcanobacterium bovis]